MTKKGTTGVIGLARKAFCTHPKNRRRFITGGVMDPGDVQCLDCGKWEAVEINEKDWSKSRWFWTRQHPYGPEGRQLDSSNPFIDENIYA